MMFETMVKYTIDQNSRTARNYGRSKSWAVFHKIKLQNKKHLGQQHNFFTISIDILEVNSERDQDIDRDDGLFGLFVSQSELAKLPGSGLQRARILKFYKENGSRNGKYI